jgi:hypothetical protein
MSNDILTIFCVVHGEASLFSIEIESTAPVTKLKRKIKDEIPAWNNIAAKDLELWKISISNSIPTADELKARLKNIKLDGSDRGIEEMNAAFPVSRCFSRDNDLFEVVLVQLPAAGELYPSARVCQSCSQNRNQFKCPLHQPHNF